MGKFPMRRIRAGTTGGMTREVVFAQRLRGTAKPSAVDGNVLAVASVADGVPIHRVWAGGTIFESELVLTGATTFQQTEWLALGADGSRLSIGTVGNGNLGH